MAADGLRLGMLSQEQAMDMIGFIPVRWTDDERAYRALLVPACASPPDAVARCALADWLEERGEDGAGWRSIEDADPHPTNNGFLWLTLKMVKDHILAAPAAIISDELESILDFLHQRDGRSAVKTRRPYPTREAACKALAAAYIFLAGKGRADKSSV